MAGLEGRVAVVTGAGQGMGETFAHTLAAAGAIVAVAEVDPTTGRRTAAAIEEAGHKAIAYEVDVRDSSSIGRMVDDLVARHGRLDILVNNAGMGAGGPSEDVTEADWDRVVGVMLKGTFLCSQAAARVMIHQQCGVIINIGSIAGVGGWAQRALYTPAKAGAIALTRVLGVEWAQHGIRVVCINPGQIETSLNEEMYRRGLADREVFQNRAPARRFGSPAEIADAVAFLASDAASGIRAEVVTIDGGWTAWGGIEELVGV
ncbi:MAG: SDR family oxidoreductase [Chloroflexi bacterium]|nr:SDR family oxidoreductase [Chloroflexota bacterium]